MVRILYVGNRDRGVADPVVDNSIHGNGHAIFRQNLKVIIIQTVTIVISRDLNHTTCLLQVRTKEIISRQVGSGSVPCHDLSLRTSDKQTKVWSIGMVRKTTRSSGMNRTC